MIVGLSGKIGTGKTTVANMCVKAFQDVVPCKRIAFGDALKKEAALVYTFPLTWAYTGKDNMVPIPDNVFIPEWKGKNITVREILQRHAMVIRQDDPFYWVNMLANQVEQECDNGCRLIFVDDVRFLNELAYVRTRGACYRLEAYPGYESYSDHVSETELDLADFDRHFSPKFGKNYLQKVAESIVEMIMPVYRKRRRMIWK